MSIESTIHFERQLDTINKKQLQGKVVLLRGNDAAILHNLVTQLAQNGADVVLLYWQIPLETARQIKESAQSAGRHLLLVEQKKSSASGQVIDTIKSELGHLDVYIDLSAQKHKPAANFNRQSSQFNKPNWSLTQNVLEELVRS